MEKTQNTNTQNLCIELHGDEPTEYVSCWTREFEFTLMTEEEGTEKEYHGCYWWNSNGEEGIRWSEKTGKPNIDEHKLKTKVKELIKELSKEEGKDDFWMIPE
jgi:hypothetical protein